MDNFGFKDLEAVKLKATYNIELGDRKIEEGETIAFFDSIQIAGLQELKSRVSANGGFDNRGHVFWETTNEIRLSFSQGVFSKEQLALLTNAKILKVEEDSALSASMREYLESDDTGKIQCKYTPKRRIFVYEKSTGNKLSYTLNRNIISISKNYTDVIVDYEFDYIGGGNVLKIGQNLLNGFVELEGRTRVKDDTTGQVVTGLIKIPRLKLMSDLSIRLGAQASPIVANFNAVGVPVGSRNNSYVSEFCLLNDDIDGDL